MKSVVCFDLLLKVQHFENYDLSFGSTETKYIKLKPKIILVFMVFFQKNYIVILAFFEKI